LLLRERPVLTEPPESVKPWFEFRKALPTWRRQVLDLHLVQRCDLAKTIVSIKRE
jgi:hypothetical protein